LLLLLNCLKASSIAPHGLNESFSLRERSMKKATDNAGLDE